ncbi:MAG TPA: DsrE/DsrF/DrsH-like family protein, partial [Bacillales bacterium]|nr:DsrE/DsrF/DrsH-like family protein [Bacillales bacterium]
EKLHAGALVGSVAAMSGMNVNFFVTMNALKAFKKDVIEKQEFKIGTVGAELIGKQVPLFYELLREGKENGEVGVYGCAMAMDLMGWEKEDMVEVIDEVIGVTRFLGMAQNAQVITM